MTNDDLAERLTRLEEREKTVSEQQRIMSAQLDSLIDRFTRYEAKWGGIVMVLSAILGLVLALKSEVKRMFGWHD